MTATTTPPAGAADPTTRPGQVVLRLRSATLGFGDRTLWEGLDLDVHAGEFIAVLGANGSGKSSLLKVILGQTRLRSGQAEFLDQPIRRGSKNIGYVPQQKLADDGVPLRGKDVIALGLHGHRWGIPLPSRKRRQRVEELLAGVGAAPYRDSRLASLSGGEQQRLRIGQALAGDPRLLLLDEPLLSLDLAYQRLVSELVDDSRRKQNIAVVFVTHDINPILGMVDRVLYLANGKIRIGRPDDVLRSDVLTDMYGSPVDVIRSKGRIIVVGAPDTPPAQGAPGTSEHHPHETGAP